MYEQFDTYDEMRAADRASSDLNLACVTAGLLHEEELVKKGMVVNTYSTLGKHCGLPGLEDDSADNELVVRTIYEMNRKNIMEKFHHTMKTLDGAVSYAIQMVKKAAESAAPEKGLQGVLKASTGLSKATADVWVGLSDEKLSGAISRPTSSHARNLALLGAIAQNGIISDTILSIAHLLNDEDLDTEAKLKEISKVNLKAVYEALEAVLPNREIEEYGTEDKVNRPVFFSSDGYSFKYFRQNAHGGISVSTGLLENPPARIDDVKVRAEKVREMIRDMSGAEVQASDTWATITNMSNAFMTAVRRFEDEFEKWADHEFAEGNHQEVYNACRDFNIVVTSITDLLHGCIDVFKMSVYFMGGLQHSLAKLHD